MLSSARMHRISIIFFVWNILVFLSIDVLCGTKMKCCFSSFSILLALHKLKCAGMRGVLMKYGDGVDDEPEGEDVGDGLGGDERQWLVVGFRDGGNCLSKKAGTVKFFDRTIKKSNILVVLLLFRQSVKKDSTIGC